jgi:hypothetical protein
MEIILDVALAEWSRQVQAKLGVHLPPGTLPGAAGTVSGQVIPGSPRGYGPAAGSGRHSGAGVPGGTPVHVTGPQPRASLTGPQPVFRASGTQPPVNGTQPPVNGTAPQVNGTQAPVNGGQPGSGYNGTNGTNGNGSVPTITYVVPPGGGYSLPDDEGGDFL